MCKNLKDVESLKIVKILILLKNLGGLLVELLRNIPKFYKNLTEKFINMFHEFLKTKKI
jgi:hypothetical protein